MIKYFSSPRVKTQPSTNSIYQFQVRYVSLRSSALWSFSSLLVLLISSALSHSFLIRTGRESGTTQSSSALHASTRNSLHKYKPFCSPLPSNYSAFTNEVSSEEGLASPPTIAKPCKISLPLTYIIYVGRTIQAPLQSISNAVQLGRQLT